MTIGQASLSCGCAYPGTRCPHRPPDHTPFLRPGVDLITAEDAAEWLRQQAEDEPRATAWYLYERLTARLDRERRQACRRAVARHFAEAREHRASERDWAASEPDETFSRELLNDWARVAREGRVESVRLALAFRAAARAK